MVGFGSEKEQSIWDIANTNKSPGRQQKTCLCRVWIETVPVACSVAEQGLRCCLWATVTPAPARFILNLIHALCRPRDISYAITFWGVARDATLEKMWSRTFFRKLQGGVTLAPPPPPRTFKLIGQQKCSDSVLHEAWADGRTGMGQRRDSFQDWQ
jgi:hypothetical protein